MRLVQAKQREEEKFEIVEVLKCMSCGEEIVDRFREGDYVGKAVGKCKRCGGDLIVYSINARRRERQS